jgi:hypothetical protein
MLMSYSSVKKVPGKDQQYTNCLIFIQIYFVTFKVCSFRNDTLTLTNSPIIKTFLNAVFGIEFSSRREFSFMSSTEWNRVSILYILYFSNVFFSQGECIATSLHKAYLPSGVGWIMWGSPSGSFLQRRRYPEAYPLNPSSSPSTPEWGRTW